MRGLIRCILWYSTERSKINLHVHVALVLHVHHYFIIAVKPVYTCITVTLGKWPGDRYIQVDCYTQVSFKLP